MSQNAGAEINLFMVKHDLRIGFWIMPNSTQRNSTK
jgi:hypothetical protein